MANGRHRSSTVIQSNGTIKLEAGTASLALTKQHDRQLPSRMTEGDLAGPAAIQPETDQLSYGSRPLVVEPKEFQEHNQEPNFGKNASIPTSEGDPETFQERSPLEATPRIRARDAIQPRSMSSTQSSSIDHSPLRQGSAYFYMRGMRDEGSEVDDEALVRQTRARERVVIWRERVSRTRRKKREMRNELRQLRENARLAFEKLTRKVSEAAAFGRLPENITQYYEAIRLAQDNLGPVEDAYDNLESRLDEEEDELEQEEDHFYRHYKFETFHIPDNKIENPLSPLLEPYDPLEFEEIQTDALDNSLKGQYMEKKQEAEQLKQELVNLEDDYFRLSEDAKFRKRHNLRLTPEAATFLSDYSESHREILDSLHKVEDELFNLQDDCVQQGLFDGSEYLYEARNALYDEILDFVEETEERSQLRVARRHLDYVAPNSEYEKKRQYVNNWLLEWMQDSSIDIMMLEAQIYIEYPDTPEKFENLDNGKWSELVLQNWNTDSMGESTDFWFRQSRNDDIAGDTGRFENTNTGFSGISDSLRSLDAMIDEDEMLENVVIHSDSVSIATELANPEFEPEMTPKKLSVTGTIPVITTHDYSPTSFKSRLEQPPIPHRPKSLQLPSRSYSAERTSKRLSVDFSSLNRSLNHSISFRSI